MADVLSAYISCGCNRTPHALDWNRNGVIIYGSCRSVAIYDPKVCNGGGIVKKTLSKHSGRVNSVRWISTPSGSASSFVSSSSDSTCILWKAKDLTYVPVGSPLKHDSIVNIADGIHTTHSNNEIETFIASATAGSNVIIWSKHYDSDEINAIQTINFHGGFILDLKFIHLPFSKVIILACAGEDSTITLWAWSEVDKQFINVLKLTGHDDWVRGLDFTIDDSGDVLLASCSQDNLVRVWRVRSSTFSVEESDNEIKLKKTAFTVSSAGEKYIYDVMLETVLSGHENWIYGIQWHPPICDKDNKHHQPMKLLTSSMDKTMIIWSFDEEADIWMDNVRVGEVGGNTLGFYGSKFSPDGQSIVAHGYQGAFHMWHQAETDVWKPGVTVGGHFSEVQDLVWDVHGNFLISASSDQTTRLHAPWVQDGMEKVTWHEIARPQVHGYDMTCLAIAKDYLLVSGADEKVLRTFQAPKNFVENLRLISGINLNHDITNLPEGANVPSLGLSNKAVYENDIVDEEEEDAERHPNDLYPEMYFKPMALAAPPTEEHLLQSTLWPEVQKLYGHGYELFCTAANLRHNIIASACKASQSEHAAIIIWSIATWQPLCRLIMHKLTVTQLAFSPDDRYLLSVSRDRTWALHEVEETPQLGLKCVAKSSKGIFNHSRIIWACAWTHDSKYFITVSRDKKLAIWGKDGQKEDDANEKHFATYHVAKDFHDSITAVDAAPHLVNQQYLIACGLDDGTISLHLWWNSSWINCRTIDNSIGHDMTVKRLQFRPQNENRDKEEDYVLSLASCGSDFSVRIFKLNVSSVS